MSHKVASVFMIFLLFLLITLIPLVTASPDILTRDPSWTYREGPPIWQNPTNAYTSDDNYASASISGGKQVWHNYNFQDYLTGDDNITKVEIGVEHYETEGNEELNIMVSWDGGATWSEDACVASEDVEILDWLDATDLTDWNLTKLSDPNLRIKVRYESGVGGCYANNTFFVVYDEKEQSYSLQSPTNIHKGDTLLVWNETSVHHEEVIRVDIHNGTWEMLDFYSGNLTFRTPTDTIVWEKHLEVTNHHPMWNPTLRSRQDADTFMANDSLTHINRGDLITLPIDKIKTRQFKGYVYSIVVKDQDSCLFAKSFSPKELEFLQKISQWRFIGTMDNIALAIKVPFTAYLDWIPVRITYSPPVVARTITFYIYDGGYLLVNGTQKENETSTEYNTGTVLNLTGVKNKTGWSLFWKYKNFTWTASNSTSNPYYYTVSTDDTIQTYFEPNQPANLAAFLIFLFVAVPVFMIFYYERKRK